MAPGRTYDVSEPVQEGFTTAREGCDGMVPTLPPVDPPVCTITNTAQPGPAPPEQFPIGIFVKCVDNFDDGTFAAAFGYYSPNPIPVTVPIGPQNTVTPTGRTADGRRRSSRAAL